MSPEAKSVKLASLASLIVGAICVILSVYVMATADVDLSEKTFLLLAVFELASFGFVGARAANVPSDIPNFAKQVAWSPVMFIAAFADFAMNDALGNMLMVAPLVVCFVLSLVLAALANKAARAIKQA